MSRHSYLRFAILVLLALSTTVEAQQERIRVNSADDLPRRTYPITGSASALLEDDAQFATLAKQLAADLRADLAKYEIADRATLKEYYGTLGSLALLDGRHDVALAYADSVRAIQDKPGLQALAGTLERALVAAAGAPPAERASAFREAYRAELAAVPWDVAEAELKSLRGRLERQSPAMLLGVVEAQVDPVARSGAIPQQMANFLVNIRTYLQVRQPLQRDMSEVLGEVIAAHATTKSDIWAARAVSLEGRPGLTPVVIAIWDSGTDVAIFGDRVYTNPEEVPDNGRDDDGNGFADDVHGFAFDLHGGHTTGVLLPLTIGPQEAAKYRRYLKGRMDLQAGVVSREANEVRQLLSQLSREDYATFAEGLSQYSHYAHGTHVAGIAVAGNPAARILVARYTGDHRRVADLPTIEGAEAYAKMYRESVEYFRARGVRVVNMSWFFAPWLDERTLEQHNVGTPEERKALARKLYDIGADALRAAIQSAPDILFVAAAGNTNNDNRFTSMAPASFELPNLITAAAVDRAGDEAAFTSYGKVDVYANGYEVVSYLPGGETRAASGTSMATPQVANLAAKLLAVHPQLTVAQLREAILGGAEEKTIGPGKRILLLHPVRSMEIANRLAGAPPRDER